MKIITVLLPIVHSFAWSAPKRSDILGRSQLLEQVQRHRVSSPADFYELFQSNRWSSIVGNFSHSKAKLSDKRYLYSPKWGWLDLKHFAAGAWANSLLGVSGQSVLWRGEKVECKQAEAGSPSRWNYEDLISNLLGTHFFEYYRNRLLGQGGRPIIEDGKRATFSDILSDYLTELGFVDDPLSIAPNSEKLSDDDEMNDLWQNRKYQALFTTAAPKEYGRLDRSVLNYLKIYLEKDHGCVNACVGDNPSFLHSIEIEKAAENFQAVWNYFIKP